MELYDKLTGLYQVKFFKELLKKEVVRSARYGRPACVIVMEIQYDFFEKSLDLRKELAYRIHREMGAAVREIAREVDFGGRISGEVLALVLPETDREGGAFAAERLRKEAEQKEIGSGGLTEHPVKVALNLGVASFPENGRTAKELLENAEKAMAEARIGGGNRSLVAPPLDEGGD
ncbi:MAG: GGDEF domain-containing protein [Candidatus Eremiobacteraeota bacterium]|nr:GGDEF domain-containing protein [Candidatus Eremiobacteraeota bacterium]